MVTAGAVSGLPLRGLAADGEGKGNDMLQVLDPGRGRHVAGAR
jgi:hypothetical protein